MSKIQIIKGRMKTFELFIQDKDGRPKDITGYSLIRASFLHDNGTLKKYAPKSAGVDEVQTLTFSEVPDDGIYKIQIGDEITTSLAFDADNAAIQAALNLFDEFSGIVVTGSYAAGVILTFTGSDGKRQQALAIITDSTLEESATAVSIEIVETSMGEEASGVAVVEEKCGHLSITLSTDDVGLLKAGNDQNIDLYVRIGTDDLDFDPRSLISILDVIDLDC